VGTLLPALGFFNVYFMQFSFVADHFQYHASVALIAGLAAVLTRWTRFRPVLLAQGALLLVLGTRTWAQATAYVSPKVLWEDTVSKNPGAWIAHNNLALLLEEDGEDAEAQRHYRLALTPHVLLPRVHSNLGSLLAERGDFGEAVEHFETALRLAPRFFPARFNLATALERQGKWSDAAEQYREALRLNSDDADAHFGLGAALHHLGDAEGARQAVENALRLDPSHEGAVKAMDMINRDQP